MKKIFMHMALVVFFFLSSTNLSAEIPSNLLQDMFPSKGFLVKVAGDRLLIDLDSKNGVRVGDIFAIFSPGEQIIHPITKKIIGVLEENAGVLKVVAVKDGYSIAKRISGTREIKEGLRVEKYSELKVLFLDYAGNPKLYDELRTTFQAMEWESYEKGIALKPAESTYVSRLAGYDLYVVSQKGKITIYDGRHDKIREYPVAEPEMTTVQKTSPYEERPVRKIGRQSKSVAGEYGKLFGINKVVRCMDGKIIDGAPYYVLATAEEVVLYKYENGKMKKFAAIRDFEGEPVAVFLEDMDNNGSHEIVVNSYQEGNGSTTVYSVNGERVHKISEFLPFFTALYDTDGDGIRETKLIQFIEGDNFWGRIEKASFRNGTFSKAGDDVPVPKNFHILGGFITDIDGDGSLESGYYSPSGKILIYRGDAHLWTSPGVLGGSIVSVPYRLGKGEFSQPSYVIIDQPPAVINVGRDKGKKILLNRSDASGYTIISSYPSHTGGYISSLEKSETGFKVNNLTEKIDGAVQNVVVMGNEIIFTKVDRDALSGKGSSYVLSFPIR